MKLTDEQIDEFIEWCEDMADGHEIAEANNQQVDK